MGWHIRGLGLTIGWAIAAALMAACSTEGHAQFHGTAYSVDAPACEVEPEKTVMAQPLAIQVRVSDLDPYQCRVATLQFNGHQCEIPLNSMWMLPPPGSECRTGLQEVNCGGGTVHWAVLGLVGGGIGKAGEFRLFLSVLVQDGGGPGCRWIRSLEGDDLREGP